MRDHLRFHLAKPLVVTEDNGESGALSVGGADWFVEVLGRVRGLALEQRLCQEDWGVVAFATRAGKRFWIGLTSWPDGDGEWLVHVHHASFAWTQRLSRSGREALRQLISDVHSVLCSDSEVSRVVLLSARDLR